MNNNNLHVTPTSLPVDVKEEPFRATAIWNAVVEYTRHHVEVRSHTVKRKTFSECFSGADVVDIVFHHLRTFKASFVSSINREKAVKMCQLFLDFQIMTVVYSEQNNLCSFEDSSTTLYRFKSDSINHPKTGCEADKCDKPSVFESSGIEPNVDAGNARGSRIGRDFARLSAALRRNQQQLSAGASTPKSSKKRNSSVPDQSFIVCIGDNADNIGADIESSPVETEIVQEMVLNSLLVFLDIPLLDDILHYLAAAPIMDRDSLCHCELTSIAACKEDNWRNRDTWWQAALACVETLPTDVAVSIMNSSLSESASDLQKIRFFYDLSEKITTCRLPVWPPAFGDIHLGLFRLLMETRIADALRVLQLSVALLNSADRVRAHRLFSFLREASDVSAVQLSVVDVNHTVVEHAFCEIFTSSQLLTCHQAGQILAFVVANSDVMCDLPCDVKDAIDARLGVHSACSVNASLPQECQCGELGLPVESADSPLKNTSLLRAENIEKAYCHRISVDEFQSQCHDLTDRALVDMMNAILDNTRIPLKEKKRRLKQFMKHHARLGLKYFSDMV